MAYLYRQGSSVYSSIDGLQQPSAVQGDTTGTMAPTSSATANTYRGVGVNPQVDQSYNPYYFTPTAYPGDPGYDFSRRQYDTFTSAFGQLGSYFGPNINYAMSNQGFQAMYGGTKATLSSGGVGVTIDPDLGNKQAEFGTIAYFRKLGSDLQPLNIGAYNFAQDVVASRNINYAQRLAGERAANPDVISRIADYNDVQTTALEHLAGQYGNVRTTVTPVSYEGWNKPNQTFVEGGAGIAAFSSSERLAPTSVSQGTGLLSGPTISQVNTGLSFLQKYAGPDVNILASEGQYGTTVYKNTDWTSPLGFRSTTTQFDTSYKNMLDSINLQKYWG